LQDYTERGYLLENYRFFHIAQPLNEDIGYHYHTFHKLVIPLKGTLTYVIEGRHYHLEPFDIAFVGRGCVHKPEKTDYCDRIVIYLSAEYLLDEGSEECDLQLCFNEAQEKGHFVLRVNNSSRNKLDKLLLDLEECYNADDYGKDMLGDALVKRLLVELARMWLKQNNFDVENVYDEVTVQLIKYINEHLTEDLSIDSLAETFYVSKFHLMRKFKDETGYTLHNYISSKRLILSQQLIERGMTATDACYHSGFRDYSSFYRAYRKLFGKNPKD